MNHIFLKPNSNATSSDAVAGGCLSSPRLLNTKKYMRQFNPVSKLTVSSILHLAVTDSIETTPLSI